MRRNDSNLNTGQIIDVGRLIQQNSPSQFCRIVNENIGLTEGIIKGNIQKILSSHNTYILGITKEINDKLQRYFSSVYSTLELDKGLKKIRRVGEFVCDLDEIFKIINKSQILSEIFAHSVNSYNTFDELRSVCTSRTDADFKTIKNFPDILERIWEIDNVDKKIRHQIAIFKYLSCGATDSLEANQEDLLSRIALRLINNEEVPSLDLVAFESFVLSEEYEDLLAELKSISSEFAAKHNVDEPFIIDENDRGKTLMAACGLVEDKSFSFNPEENTYSILMHRLPEKQRAYIISLFKIDANPQKYTQNITLHQTYLPDWSFYTQNGTIIPIRKDNIIVYYAMIVRLFSYDLAEKLFPQLEKINLGLEQNDREKIFSDHIFKQIWLNSTLNYLRLSNNDKKTYNLQGNLFRSASTLYERQRQGSLQASLAIEEVSKDFFEFITTEYNLAAILTPNEAAILFPDLPEGTIHNQSLPLSPGYITYSNGIKERVMEAKPFEHSKTEKTRRKFSDFTSDFCNLPGYFVSSIEPSQIIIDANLIKYIFPYYDEKLGIIKNITIEGIVRKIYAKAFYLKKSYPKSEEEKRDFYESLVKSELDKYLFSQKNVNVIFNELTQNRYFQNFNEALLKDRGFNMMTVYNIVSAKERSALIVELSSILSLHADVISYIIQGENYFNSLYSNVKISFQKARVLGVTHDIRKNFPNFTGMNLEYDRKTSILDFALNSFIVESGHPKEGIQELYKFFVLKRKELDKHRQRYCEAKSGLFQLAEENLEQTLITLLPNKKIKDEEKHRVKPELREILVLKQLIVGKEIPGLKCFYPHKQNNQYFFITNSTKALESLKLIFEANINYQKKMQSIMAEKEEEKQYKKEQRKEKRRLNALEKNKDKKTEIIEEKETISAKYKDPDLLDKGRKLFEEIFFRHKETLETLSKTSYTISKTKSGKSFNVGDFLPEIEILGLTFQQSATGKDNIVSISHEFISNRGSEQLESYFLRKITQIEKEISKAEEKEKQRFLREEAFNKEKKQMEEWYEFISSEKFLEALNFLKLGEKLLTASSHDKINFVLTNDKENVVFTNVVDSLDIPALDGIEVRQEKKQLKFIVISRQLACEANGGIKQLQEYINKILQEKKEVESKISNSSAIKIQKMVRGFVEYKKTSELLQGRREQKAAEVIQRSSKNLLSQYKDKRERVDLQLKEILDKRGEIELKDALSCLPYDLKKRIFILDQESVGTVMKGKYLSSKIVYLTAKPHDVDFLITMSGLAKLSKKDLTSHFSKLLNISKESIKIYNNNKTKQFSIKITLGAFIDIIIVDKDRPSVSEKDWITNLDAAWCNIKGKIKNNGLECSDLSREDLFFSRGYYQYFLGAHKKTPATTENMLENLLRGKIEINKSNNMAFTRTCLTIASGYGEVSHNKESCFNKLLREEVRPPSTPFKVSISSKIIAERLETRINELIKAHAMEEDKDLRYRFFKTMREALPKMNTEIDRYLERELQKFNPIGESTRLNAAAEDIEENNGASQTRENLQTDSTIEEIKSSFTRQQEIEQNNASIIKQ